MEYKTIKNAANDEFIVKRSRFIAHIMPVSTQTQALEFINEIKSKYWDATHNVYAYVLREGQTKRYSDDGEPQGTAGIPTLDVLNKENLTDCAVVVTRYFGGIMLGAGGLVRAYSQSSKIAVDAGKIIIMGLCDVLRVCCDYNFYGRLTSLVPENAGTIENAEFSDNVEVIIQIPQKNSEKFNANLVEASFGRFFSEKISELYAEI